MKAKRALLSWALSPYLSDEALAHQATTLSHLGLSVQVTREVPESLRGVSILVVSSRTPVTEELLATADILELVVTGTSGHEHLDLAAIKRGGAKTARCPECRRDAVIDTTLAMALSFWRDLDWLGHAAKDGHWMRGQLPARPLFSIRGRTVGLIGRGVIGARAEEVWRSLGAEVLFHDPRWPAESCALDELAGECDLVSLHCAANASTRHLVGERFLQAMPEGAILINTARGDCVDEEALMKARHLGGIGLDVFAREPWPGRHPLAGRPRVHLTPHAAGWHRDLPEVLLREIFLTVKAHLDGAPLPHPIG